MRKFLTLCISVPIAMATLVGTASANEAAAPHPSSDKSSHHIIEGGTTQSIDPTAYDYVPEGADDPGNSIQPRSASGYQPINGFGFTYNGIDFKVTTGELQHRIIGSGNYIESEGSQYRVPSTICNWRVDYQNRTGAQIHRTFVGQKNIGCSFGAVADTGPRNVYVNSGSQQCARLYVADTFRGEQCHNIG